MSEMFEVVFEWMQTIDAASFLFFVFISNFNDKRNYILVISSVGRRLILSISLHIK